jgi:hypothetical protein
MDTPTAAAGWYPAADGQSSRWWDGYRWTEHVQALQVPAIPSGWYPTAARRAMRWWDGSRWSDDFLVGGYPTTLEKMRRNGRNGIAVVAGLAAAWIVLMVVAGAIAGPAAVWRLGPMAVVLVVAVAIMPALFRRQIQRALTPVTRNP